MKAKLIPVVAIVLMMAVLPFACSSDADVNGTCNDQTIKLKGSVDVYIINTDGAATDVAVEIYNVNNNKLLGTATVTMAEESSQHVKVKITAGEGTYNAVAKWTNGTESGESTFALKVEKGIWDGYLAYTTLVIIAIIIIVALLLHIRSTPKVKSTTTFTEIETAKKASEAEKVAPAGSTEKKMYQNDAPKEKETFTSVENKKKEKKNSSEPVKYVSSRRK